MTNNIRVLAQSSIRIESGAGVIYFDPYMVKEDFNDADYIFITHDHHDHFSPADLLKVCKEDSVLIVPEKMESQSKEVSKHVGRIYTVKPGETKDIEGISVETVPAYNLLKPFHPKNAGWVGYILTLDGNRIYVAGDTDATKEAKSVKCDIALIPIGGTFTMDAKKAADFINTIKPKVAIPTHYGTVVGSPKDGETFKEAVKDPVMVELKIEA